MSDTTEVTADWIKILRTIVKGTDKDIDSASIVVDERRLLGPANIRIGGNATLCVTKRERGAEHGLVWLRFEQPLIPAEIEAYNPSVRPLRSRVSDTLRLVAQAAHYRTDVRSPLRTLAALVKPGDVLKAHFLIANDSPLMLSKGVTVDQCHLLVYRKAAPVGAVHIRTEVLPVESPVTMIDSSYRGETS